MENTILEEIEYRNHIIHIHPDTDVMNPREYSEGFGTMVCWHRNYQLGDVQPKEDPNEYIARLPKDVIILPLYLYDHSGITMNTTGFSCPWDSGQVGWIYVEREKVRKEYGIKRVSKKAYKKAIDLMRAEVKEYDEYLRGDAVGYVVYDNNENHIDSCWGYLGDEGYKFAVKCAKESVDAKYPVKYVKPMVQQKFANM